MGGARRAGDPPTELRLLGPIEASRGGRRLAVGGPKPRALLAVLALEAGRVVSVDRLVEELWPGEPPETAAHAVQVYVSQLRKSLGSQSIVRRGPGYTLELERERVDVHRFAELARSGHEALAAGDAASAATTLREALGLWRGPALAEFLYEPFAQEEIARLEERRTTVLEDRIEADLALERNAEIVPELEALVHAQPLRERPRGLLMIALYRSGRQADALAAYRAARETLVGELGIEPGPELRELEGAILRQDESLLLPETAAPRPAMQFRRLVTILFSDVVESMSLGATLDAEALASVQRRYFDTVSAAITRHEGSIEKYAGDAVMAAFGVPVSHEDDALRAARAALDIQIGIEALNEHLVRDHGIGIEIRTGIAAGEVVTTAAENGQRFIAGDPVAIAARLQNAAAAGEVVVGEVVARLIDHAAWLKPHGTLEIAGRPKPLKMFRLLELTPVTPAFERRMDAPLAGRKRELTTLRKSLKGAVDSRSVRVVLVVAAPGVGKSRLAAELRRRTTRATTLWGRCLSYGDGITYWPLREILAEAPAGGERDALVAALDADIPRPAPEIALVFRQFCEALARERPLVVVLDDLHWGEPTFLELVEHVSDKGKGPILVVGLARDELLERSPSFLEGRDNVDRLLLDTLTADETDELIGALGGTALESDKRRRIVETSEGNPLFLEQLLALALEGRLTEQRIPETIQALLAARLDRLGPGERAVLERASVIGKEFARDDLVALLDPGAAPTADFHLQVLANRGFVRSRGDAQFDFRHLLVRDAVYRAAPKRLRADLHERFADRLDTAYEELPDLDEFVGYHLEQAYGLRVDLGQVDRRSARLAQDAGRRLGDAGVRALMRGDVPATRNLLERALSLAPRGESLRRELLCELGIARFASGLSESALELFAEAIAESRENGDRRIELRARVESEYIGVRTLQRAADDLLAATAEGIPVLEGVRDQRALGRTWLLAGWARGNHGDHKGWLEGAERALEHYKAAGWPTSTCLGEIAAALYWGPTPVADAVTRCEELLREEALDRSGGAYLNTFLGGLIAQQDDFTRARALVQSGRTTLEALGLQTAVETYCAPVSGDIELLAGDAAASARIFRALCDELERSKDFSHLASRASDLAEALLAQELVQDSEEWTEVAERNAAPDDVSAQMSWRSVRARIHARHSAHRRAAKLAREAVHLAESTDDLNRRAKVHRDLGEVLQRAGNASGAASAYDRAGELYAQKGNLVGAARVRSLREELALV